MGHGEYMGLTLHERRGLTYFGRTVEATDEVWCNIVFSGIRSRAKVAYFYEGFLLVDLKSGSAMGGEHIRMCRYQDVIWLDIGMDNI